MISGNLLLVYHITSQSLNEIFNVIYGQQGVSISVENANVHIDVIEGHIRWRILPILLLILPPPVVVILELAAIYNALSIVTKSAIAGPRRHIVQHHLFSLHIVYRWFQHELIMVAQIVEKVAKGVQSSYPFVFKGECVIEV